MRVKFPADFKWGTAVSAFQVEYGSSEEKIPDTDWYRWATSDQIKGEKLVSGDSPANGDGFWELYEGDLKRASELHNNSIRLSIEWARIFPESTEDIEVGVVRSKDGYILDIDVEKEAAGKLSERADHDAVEHYRKIFDCAKGMGLDIFLTVYHWPLPSWLHDPFQSRKDPEGNGRKGWLDEKTIIEFGKYAHFISSVFTGQVEMWETINEPDAIASQGYFFGDTSGYPPGISDIPMAFRVQKNLIFAHNVAYLQIKRNSSKPVGIGISPPYLEAADERPESARVTDFARYMNNEWFLNGLIYGVFDDNFDMLEDSRVEGLAGTDFIGIDYYTRMRISYNENEVLGMEFKPCQNCTDFDWDIYPSGIRKVSKWMFEKYRLPLYILENGIADSSDSKRPSFIHDHLLELWKSIELDGVPVRGYYHWSLIDNFEWARGYSMRFGLYEVDYSTKERRKRKSADVYSEICRTGEIEYEQR